jgi:large subunit ribosomal protein L13
MKTVSIRKEETQPGGQYAPDWLLVDAQGQTLGRLASQIATLLRGKHKPIFTPHVDTGDFVVIVNAANVKLSGNKLRDKWYYHHTGYPGGVKAIWAERLLEQKPTELVRLAIKRMMPRNALNRKILHTKLKIYPGAEHPHQAQKPRAITLPH